MMFSTTNLKPKGSGDETTRPSSSSSAIPVSSHHHLPISVNFSSEINVSMITMRPPAIGPAFTANTITFSRVGDIMDEDEDDEPMEVDEEEEEDQISEVTSPSSSEHASFHTLSETSSMIEDGSDIISITDSTGGSSRGSKRKLDDVLSAENGGDEAKVAKRRIYHRRANPFPRVLKRDIRRDYGTMLLNVMNSFDGELTSKFFRTFCVQDCYKFDLFPEVKNYNLPCVRQVNGLDQIVFSLLHDLSHTPDCVLTMKSSHIRQRSDVKGSQVVLRVLFQGTKIYQNKNCNLEGGSQRRILQQQQQQQQQLQQEAAPSSSSSVASASHHSVASKNSDSGSVMNVSSGDESDVSSVYSHQSSKSRNSVSDIGSMWLPLPPTVDENALKSLDLQAIEKYFENIGKSGGGSSSSSMAANAQQLLSSVSGGSSSSSENIQQTLSNILQQFTKNGNQEDFINELMQNGNVDITKEEWYENAGISLLSKPFPITVDGTIIMHLDDDHRIRRFQFVSSSLVANNFTGSPALDSSTS